MNTQRETQRTKVNRGLRYVKGPACVWAVAFILVLAATLAVAPGVQAQKSGPDLNPATLKHMKETISVAVGRSRVVHTPWPVKRVAVADPTIADVQVLEPDQVLVVGQATGTTDLIMWNDAGQMWQAVVRVDVDVAIMNDKLRRLFPGSTVALTRSDDVLIASGQVATADQATQLNKFLEASKVQYVDMTRMPGIQQVQLQVRVAEANRVAIRKLGVNALQTGDNFFGTLATGSDTGGAINPVSMGVAKGALVGDNLPFKFTQDTNVSPLVSLVAGFPGSDLELFIQALAENQYLRILAEPNLVALSGEEASFLAGGEFPIPVVQGSNAGGGTTITIEYKEFGVRLRFRPEVLGGNVIRLHVAPEVSDLTTVGAVEIEGFSIPAILTRRSETTLELNSGQTFAMAGLLNHTDNARNSQIPMMGDLPVLGPLFRSVRYQSGETELVILVTASLVKPLSIDAANAPVPGSLYTPPNDWELFMEGRIEGGVRRLAYEENTNVEKFRQLAGPGPWASYHGEQEQK